MSDIFAKCSTDEGYFGSLRFRNDRYFSQPVLDSLPSPHMTFQGKECIMWSINNYLGLLDHPEIKEITKQTLESHGIGSPMGSRMMSGTTSDHLAFERDLADFSRKQSAILYNYGYMGVLGIISSLVRSSDIVVMDKLSHACIVDGCILSRATIRSFRHNNINDLESVLQSIHKKRLPHQGLLLVLEGVYGMTGDIAPLPEIVKLKEKYDFRIFIDDAHGCGVVGAQGRGAGELLGVQNDIDIYFGTFAKSFAGIGGFSASEKKVSDWIAYNARPQVFAKSMPQIYVKGMQVMLKLIMKADSEREKLFHISKLLKNGLRNLGYSIGPGLSAICSVFLNARDDRNQVVQKSLVYLRERGVFVTAVVYPIIPRDLCMIRMIPTASHSESDVDKTLKKFKELKKAFPTLLQLGPEEYKKLSILYQSPLTNE